MVFPRGAYAAAHAPRGGRRGRAAAALALAAAWWAGPAAAAAQQDGAEAQQAPEAGEESPELRALRLAEERMFGDRDRGAGATGSPPPGTPPPVVTSDAPPAPPQRAEGSEDLSWLRELELPDLPVRWDDRVVRYLELFRDDPRGRNIMAAWLRRVERYGPLIRRTLREMGLPEDLLYVAMIESGFDPTARSRAAAAGIWQFVARTGAEYGLEQTHWVDERLDPVKATVAAARYLGDLKARFGSWELALAAYNMGYGALLRAIRKYNTNDYWVLARLEAGLPFETTIYVAKVMACAIVGHNPERFGYQDVEVDGPLESETVRVPGGVALKLLARAAELDSERLAALNPELHRGRTPPGERAYPLRLPADHVERFTERWQRFRPSQPAHRTYVMRLGETLSDVAHRFRTSERKLRRLNDIEGDGELGAGSPLLVPAVEPRELERDEEDLPVVAIPEPPPSHPDRRRVFYEVRDGDTLAEIARFFEVVPPLQPGMFLQLFVSPEADLSKTVVLSEDEVRVLVVGTEAFFDFHERQKDRVRFRYTVRSGDTLTRVARRFGLTVGDIARINQFSRDSELRTGQEIIVYAERESIPAKLRAKLEHQAGDAQSGPDDEAQRDAEEQAQRNP